MQSYLKHEVKLMCLWLSGIILPIVVGSLLSCGKHTIRQNPPDDLANVGPSHQQATDQDGPIFDSGEQVLIGGNDLTPVNFDFDRYNIRDDQVVSLVGNMQIVRSAGEKVGLEGHCDERGTIEYNLALGQRRADAVRRFFIRQDIDPALIVTVSYGKERPVDAGHTEAAWQENRRVTFLRTRPDP